MFVRLSIVIGLIALLAVLCGGLIPGVLPACALAALAGLLLVPGAVIARARLLWWAMCLFMVWNLAQLVPLPDKLLGPRRSAAFGRVDAVLSSLYPTDPATSYLHAPVLHAAVLAAPPLATHGEEEHRVPRLTPRRLTLNLAGTVRSVLYLASCVSIFWLVASLGADHRLLLLRGIVVIASAVAIGGLIGRYVIPQGTNLWWWYPIADTGLRIPFGPFSNRNIFAALMAMCAPAAFALVIPPRSHRHRDDRGYYLDAVPTLFPGERSLFGVLCFIVIAAVFLSLSRGGSVALLAGVGVATLFYVPKRPRLSTAAALAFTGVVMALLFWPDEAFQQRMLSLNDPLTAADIRLDIWQDSLTMWKAFPWSGCGPGAYEQVYEWFTGTANTSTSRHGENQYLTFLAEAGVFGALLALFTAIAYGQSLFKAAARDHRSRERSRSHRRQEGRSPSPLPVPLLASAAGALTAVFIHGFVDIPLLSPLNGLVFAALLGVAMPLPLPMRLSAGRIWRSGWFDAVTARVCVVLLAAAGWGLAQRWLPLAYVWDHPGCYHDAGLHEAASGLPVVPTYWYAWQVLARECGAARQEFGRAARAAADRTAAESAANAESAAAVAAAWRPAVKTTAREVDIVQRPSLRTFLDLELACQRQAVLYNPLNYLLWSSLAAKAWTQWRIVEARTAYTKALSLNPLDYAQWKKWIDLEWNYKQIEQIRRLVAFAEKSVESKSIRQRLLKDLADMETALGNIDAARAVYDQAAALDPDGVWIWTHRLSWETKHGTLEQQRDVYVRLTELMPKRHDYWWNLAKLELELNNSRAAERALAQAVRLRPQLRQQADSLWRKHVLTKGK